MTIASFSRTYGRDLFEVRRTTFEGGYRLKKSRKSVSGYIFARRVQTSRPTYFVNGRRVSRAVWCILRNAAKRPGEIA